jgi:hypothetical protein
VISAVETASLKLDRDCGKDFSKRLLAASRAHSQCCIRKILHLGEIVSAVIATVMISWHGFLPISNRCVRRTNLSQIVLGALSWLKTQLTEKRGIIEV